MRVKMKMMVTLDSLLSISGAICKDAGRGL
jgi:hypothetical protein